MNNMRYVLLIGALTAVSALAQDPVVRTAGSLANNNLSCGAGNQEVQDCSIAKSAVQLTSAPTKQSYVVGSGGVTASTPVKWSGGQVVAVTGVEGILGIAETTVSAAGTVVVDLIGKSSCIASGAITADHYLTANGGVCVDSGQTARAFIPSTTNILGKADASYTNGQTVGVDLIGPFSGGTESTHQFSITIDGGGSVLTAGATGDYPVSALACSSIYRWDITGDVSGSVSVDIWKRNNAIPTTSQKISGTDPVTLSSQQFNIHQPPGASWTPLTVAIDDIWGAAVTGTPTSVKKVTVQVWCH